MGQQVQIAQRRNVFSTRPGRHPDTLLELDQTKAFEETSKTVSVMFAFVGDVKNNNPPFPVPYSSLERLVEAQSFQPSRALLGQSEHKSILSVLHSDPLHPFGITDSFPNALPIRAGLLFKKEGECVGESWSD